jgi:hypothetical protein
MKIGNFAVIFINFLFQTVIDANLNALFQKINSLFQFLLLTFDKGHPPQNFYLHFDLVFVGLMLSSHPLHFNLLQDPLEVNFAGWIVTFL